LSISQTGYPKEVILNKDTVVAITYPQLKEINAELELSKGNKVIIDSLESSVQDYDRLLTLGNALVINLKDQITEKNKQVGYLENITKTLQSENEKLRKISQRNKVWYYIGGAITGGLVTGLTVGFLSK